MPSRENTICRLPLLDGEPETTSEAITVQVEPGRLETLHRLFQQDEITATALIYTAWGIVLRCYTGQDETLFQTRRKSGVSLFRLSFEGDEPLSACLAKAAAEAQNTETETSEIRTSNKQPQANTAVWIQNGTFEASTRKHEASGIQVKYPEVSVPDALFALKPTDHHSGRSDSLSIYQAERTRAPNRGK